MTGKRLRQLAECGLVKPDDKISFSFKGHKFSATLAEGGILHNCLWCNPNETLKRIFETKTFTTLSDFTESCIQEKLNEYSTRYSSWKRVVHETCGRSLDEIWKEYMETKIKDTKKPTMQQMRQLNERLLERLAKANEKIDSLSAQSPATHPIILDSPHGTYMVIQRMIQHGNESCAKELGLTKFREHLKEFSTSKVVVENPKLDAKWFDSLKNDEKQAHNIARFVHTFFTSDNKKRKLDDVV